MSKLTGKIALVTGVSRGIGRSITLRLAQDGALVAVHYGKRKKEAEQVVHAIQQSGGSAFAIGADVSVLNGIRDLYAALDEALRERTGDHRFDILVNNAGIGQMLTMGEASEATFDEVMSINVKAPFFVTQHALPRLNHGGRLINISSFVTRAASPSVFAYSMSKGQ